EFNEEALRLKPLNKDVLKELFKELEFRRIAQNLLGEDIGGVEETVENKPYKPKASNGQTDLFSTSEFFNSENGKKEEIVEKETSFNNINSVEHEYIVCTKKADRDKLIAILTNAKEYCFDTETTGIDALNAEIVGMSFSVRKHQAYYVPTNQTGEGVAEVLKEFLPVFSDESKVLIGQNIKYDYHILSNYGIIIQNKLFDTMVAHFIIQPEMRHGMDLLANTYLNYEPISIETLIGKRGKNQKSMNDVPLEEIAVYAAEDADITLQLKEVFDPILKEQETINLYNDVEGPLIKVLADMEREGITLDVPVLKRFSEELTEEILAVEENIYELAGVKFNISSPKQVGEILFDHLKITDKAKKTKTGQYATSEDVLLKLEKEHAIVSKILDYRELMKLKSTYVDALPQLVDKRTGKIHTSFNQVVAVTGRLSSDNPNLQNIPIRTERGRQIRKAFIPRSEEYTLLSADYSQIELRIVASISEDPNLCQAFKEGKDIHTATAAKVFDVSESEVTKEMRYKAKSVNFGIIYGQGPFGLAENIGVSRTEAKALIDNYFKQYPAIKNYMDNEINFAREHGYVQTILGRRRWLRDINSQNATVRGFAERNAINAPIQGSAADMIKLAMINIDKEIKKQKLRSKMLLQVHDELIFDVYKPELELMQKLVSQLMKEALPLKVPVEVGMGVGNNWLEAH
ncbi:MAG: DNA polymerase I, partial [Bacteroidia bacterium]